MNMSTRTRFTLILTLALLGGVALWATLTRAAPGNAPLAQGGAPAVVSYQGEVRVAGTPYTGTGYFKFAVVDFPGTTTYWSNDGSSSGGGEPTAAVALLVSDGLFGVLLGDTSLSGMTQPLTAGVFSEPDRYLRVWFSSDGSAFSRLEPDTRIAAVPYALQAERVPGYAGVVVVARSGGDYTSVQAAINSITDATAGNPYLVWVAPGVYSETVTMKPYVHLQGAGQEATVVTSTASTDVFPPTQATLVLTHHVSLRDLTMGNGGAGTYNVALLATDGTARTLVADVTARAQGGGTYNYAIRLSGSGTGVMLQNVTALTENGSDINCGLCNSNGAAATLRGGSFTARGGGITYGILNSGSTTALEAESVTALGENGSGNYGLYNHSGAATLHGGSFTARGGSDARGIYNRDGSATLEAESVIALGENGTSDNYGLYNYNGAAATLRGGSFTARGGSDARGIYNANSFTTLEAESITALGENGSIKNYGLDNGFGGVTLRGGSFTGRGGGGAWGIYNSDSPALEAESVTALGENGSDNHGLCNYNGAATLHGGSFTARGGKFTYGILNDGSIATLEAKSVTVVGENGTTSNLGLYSLDGTASATQSVLQGADYSVLSSSSTVTVSNSRLVGGPATGIVTCVLVTWGTGPGSVSTDGSTCP